MTESELGEARRAIERLESELARTKKVQEDLWAHQIYIKARQKMTVGVFAILGLLSALGLFTAYDIYQKLVDFSTGLAENTIQERINAEVDKMVSAAEPKLGEELKAQTDALIEIQKSAVQKKIDELNDQVGAADRVAQRAGDTAQRAEIAAQRAADAARRATDVAQEADDAAKRLKQITLAAAAPEEAAQKVGGRGKSGRGKSGAGCHPLRLTESQRALVRIRQDSEKTDTVASNGLPYYRNTFTVAAHSEDRPTIPPSLTACVLDAIDRVVYNLNKRWFSPSEIVKLNKADRFSVSLRVWGTTEIDAAVYLRGERDSIQHHGMFKKAEHRELYLARGPRESRMRGDRPY